MLRNPYFHIIFRLHLIKQIFEEKKLLRALYESQTQFWPKITLEGVGLNGRDFIAKKKQTLFSVIPKYILESMVQRFISDKLE